MLNIKFSLFILLSACLFTETQIYAQKNNLSSQCSLYSEINYPEEDLPSEQDAKMLMGCTSKKLYYSNYSSQNYIKARKCAFLEIEDSADLYFGGHAMLMMIYANGYGVKQNIPLAKSIACRYEGQLKNINVWMMELSSLEKAKHEKKFDICDDSKNVYLKKLCDAKKEEHILEKKNLKLKQILLSLSAEERGYYFKLKAQLHLFLDARQKYELNINEEEHILTVMEDENLNTQTFLSLFLEEDAKKIYKEEDLKSIELELEHTINSLQRKKTIAFKGFNQNLFLSSNAVWKKYRDIWISYAGFRKSRNYKNIVSYNLTRDRLEQIKKIYSDNTQF